MVASPQRTNALNFGSCVVVRSAIDQTQTREANPIPSNRVNFKGFSTKGETKSAAAD